MGEWTVQPSLHLITSEGVMIAQSRVGASRLLDHLPLALLGHVPLVIVVVVGVHHSEVDQHLLD